MNQIFGHTEFLTPRAPQVPKYVAVHEAGDGNIKMTVRNRDGVMTEIEIPRAVADDLATSIGRYHARVNTY